MLMYACTLIYTYSIATYIVLVVMEVVVNPHPPIHYVHIYTNVCLRLRFACKRKKPVK